MQLQKISIEWAVCARPKDKVVGSISGHSPLSSRPPASEVSIISFYGETNGLTLYGGCVIAYRADSTPPGCYDSVYHSSKFFSVDVAKDYAVLILECEIPHMAHPDSLFMQRINKRIAKTGGLEENIRNYKKSCNDDLPSHCQPMRDNQWEGMMLNDFRTSEQHHIMDGIYKESITGQPQCGHIAPLSVRDHERPGG